jgi:hypothetical protein
MIEAAPMSRSRTATAATPALPSLWQALRFGLGVTAVQLAFTSIVTGGNWAALAQWDVGIFAGIVDTGYHSVIPPVAGRLDLANVSMFPGYVLWGAAFRYGLGLASGPALILASQVAAVGFWTTFGQMLRAFGLSARTTLVLAFAFLVQPATMYLVNGHSESFALWAEAGFVLSAELALRHWSSASTPQSVKRTLMWWALAALCGVAMTATRIVMVFFVAYPVLRALLAAWLDARGSGAPLVTRATVARLGATLALAVVSLAGIVGFFVYCQLAIGKWDIYFDTERIGWGMTVDWAKVFWPEQLVRFTASAKDPTGTGKLLTMVTLVAGPFVLWGAARLERARMWAVPAVVTAYLVLGATLVGRSGAGYYGMIRHLLPTLALLWPALGALAEARLARAPLSSQAAQRWIVAGAIVALLLAGLQAVYLYRYINGLWVA